MVGGLGFRIGQGSIQNVGTEQHVGIGKQQPVAGGLIGRAPHGVRLSQPTRGQFCDVHDLQPACGFGSGGNSDP